MTGRERLHRASEVDRGATASTAAPSPPARNDDAEWGDLSDKTLETVSVRRPTPRVASVSANMSAPDIDHRYELFRARRYAERPRSASRWLPWVLAIGGAAAVYWNYAWLQQHGPAWLAMGRDVVGKAVQGNQGAVPPVAGEPTADAAIPAASPQVANPSPAGPGGTS